MTGRSCHGSMPWEGLNPLEYGGAIVAEAARRYDAREGFLDHPFLGHGTRTASWATARHARATARCRTASPSASTGGSPSASRRSRRGSDVEALDAVRRRPRRGPGRRGDGAALHAEDLARVPGRQPPDLPGWLTPEEHPAIRAAVAAYRGVVTPHVTEPAGGASGGGAAQGAPRRPLDLLDRRRRLPGAGRRRLDRVFPSPRAGSSSGDVKHPAMFGIGAGIEQNTHKIGECVDRASCSTRSRCSPASRVPSWRPGSGLNARLGSFRPPKRQLTERREAPQRLPLGKECQAGSACPNLPPPSRRPRPSQVPEAGLQVQVTLPANRVT